MPRFERAARRAAGDPVLAERDRRRADLLARSRSAPAAARTSPTRSPASARRAGGCSRSPTRTASRSASTGTHPLADYREQHIIDTEHYRRVEDGLKYVAWRNNTFSLHVHVGVRGADRAVAGLRPAAARAAAAAGDQRQLAVRRRARLRPALRPARRPSPSRSRAAASRTPSAPGQAWRDYVELLVRTDSIVEFTQLWWSVRPHHTLRHGRGAHLRRPDHRRARPTALAELIVACVAAGRCARSTRAGPPDIPGRLIEENMWRAIRYGLDGAPARPRGAAIEEYPAAEALDRLAALEPGATSRCPSSTAPSASARMIDAGAHARTRCTPQCVRGDPGRRTPQEETVT